MNSNSSKSTFVPYRPGDLIGHVEMTWKPIVVQSLVTAAIEIVFGNLTVSLKLSGIGLESYLPDTWK